MGWPMEVGQVASTLSTFTANAKQLDQNLSFYTLG